MIKYILGFLLFISVSLLQAATITSQEVVYGEGSTLLFTATDMPQNSNDWIGIYPVGASNDWGNVVAWKWAARNGDYTFESIPSGAYEVRVFFNNSYIVEATDTFTVSAGAVLTTITTSKAVYSEEETITVTLSNMAGGNQDWVGIYPVGSSNDWGNVVAWAWTGGIIDGDVTLNPLPAGNYEARAFFNNTFVTEAVDTFSVESAVVATIETSKAVYSEEETITVTLSNMAGGNQDWVGIYPVGSSNDWGNVVAWAWTGGITEGNVTLDPLPAGNYEARAFFNNTFITEAIVSFSVEPIYLPPTVYEDAENGLANWETVSGDYVALRRYTANDGGHNFVKLTPKWIDSYTNTSEYHLAMNNSTQRVLSVDIGGDGNNMPHYVLGVRVTTPLGARRIMWNSFYNHNNIPATMKVYGTSAFMTFPSPVEQVRGFGYSDVDLWENFTVNLEDALHYFEPDNTILSVDYFLATGGNLDNLMLKSE